MRQAGVAGQLVAALFPVGDLLHTAPRIFIQRNVEAVDQLGIFVLDEKGQIFRVVFAGFRHIIPEALHDFKAHHVVVLFGQLRRAPLDFRVKVVAASVGDFQQPCHMIDAGDLCAHIILFIGHADGFQQALGAYLDAVAQPHGLYARIALHGAGQHGHGIGIVEEPGIRAYVLHVARKVHHHRDGAQCAKDTPDAQRIGNGLPQPVLFGYFKVRDGAGVIKAHLNGVDCIVGTAQGGAAVFNAAIGFDAGFVAQIVVQGGQHEVAFLQPLGIDVIQCDDAVRQRRGKHAVTEYVFGKYGGTGSQKCDFGHEGHFLS